MNNTSRLFIVNYIYLLILEVVYKVLVFEEFMKGDTTEKHARWLYTACTRPEKKLVLVRN